MRRVAVMMVVALGACDAEERREAIARELTGGEPARGRASMFEHGCGSCHEIPGVEGAEGRVGPSLDGVAGRSVLAGRLENTPANLELWIRHPQHVEPGNVMPEMGVSASEAADMAAHLYTLE